VKGEKQYAKKQGDRKKDMTELQDDTIKAIQEKQAKGYLSNNDVGQTDTREERVGSSGGGTKKQKKR